jgi:hypothetical protein
VNRPRLGTAVQPPRAPPHVASQCVLERRLLARLPRHRAA